MTEILRGREALAPRVVTVEALADRRLILGFTNGERRCFDAAPLLGCPAFRPLRDDAFFRTARVALGTVCWGEDIDLCADTLYEQSTPI